MARRAGLTLVAIRAGDARRVALDVPGGGEGMRVRWSTSGRERRHEGTQQMKECNPHGEDGAPASHDPRYASSHPSPDQRRPQRRPRTSDRSLKKSSSMGLA